LSRLVYVAGPYSSDDSAQKRANIEAAINVAIWCARNRIYYFCPHLNSAYFDDLAPDIPTEFYYQMDLAILAKFDAVLLMKGWEYSKGASVEYNTAVTLGLRTFEYPVDCSLLLEWIRENK